MGSRASFHEGKLPLFVPADPADFGSIYHRTVVHRLCSKSKAIGSSSVFCDMYWDKYQRSDEDPW